MKTETNNKFKQTIMIILIVLCVIISIGYFLKFDFKTKPKDITKKSTTMINQEVVDSLIKPFVLFDKTIINEEEYTIEYLYNESLSYNYLGVEDKENKNLNSDALDFIITNDQRVKIINKITNESYIIKNIKKAKSILFVEGGSEVNYNFIAILTSDGNVYVSMLYKLEEQLLVINNPSEFENSMIFVETPLKIKQIKYALISSEQRKFGVAVLVTENNSELYLKIADLEQWL